MESTEDPDGLYGWSRALCSPPLKVVPLACGHNYMTTHADSVAKIASTIVMLYEIDSDQVQDSYSKTVPLGSSSSHCGAPVNNDTSPKHLSRHASSLAVPQEDSMCGDGPGPPGDNDRHQIGQISFNLRGHFTDTELSLPVQQQMVPAIFQGDKKTLQLIINVDKEAENPDSEDRLRAIESIAKNFIFHARNSSLCLSQINDRNYVEF